MTVRPRTIACAVERWFHAHARDLPWRHDRDGYRALVSEAMLQQTQVARVIESFGEFLGRFPTVRTLAEADEQDVLAAWKGLGYYRRARHLHAAAKAIMNHHDGEVPMTAEELVALPGVGRYTAGSVASIVFGEAAPIVDGNVRRVLARLGAVDLDGAALERWCWEQAAVLVASADGPGAFNEGLMELGATVCTPRRPACDRCPLASHCRAAADGRQTEVPRPKKAANRRTIHHHCVLIARGDRVLLEQRSSSGLWAGMWQPPTVESEEPLEPDHVQSGLAFSARNVERIARFTHITTHREVRFHVHLATTRIRRGEWRPVTELDRTPMSNAHRKVMAYLDRAE
jgi:A/G-specific adenine glycosylase